jgi:hypothetical protein
MADGKSSTDQAEFTRLALVYLESRYSGDQLRLLQSELKLNSAHRTLFVDLCLTRQGLSRILRNREQFREEIDKQSVQSKSRFPVKAPDPLTETMILPAIKLSNGELDAQLPEVFQSATPPSTAPVRRWWQRPWRLAAAVLLPIFAGALIWSLLPGTRPPEAAKPQPDQAVTFAAPAPAFPASQPIASNHPTPSLVPEMHKPTAIVAVALNAFWDHSGQSLSINSELNEGTHSLDAGVAEIHLSGGASVVLQAPATFTIQSGNLLGLSEGQLSALVPHGTAKLTVNTPEMAAIDIGTEFGVKVSALEKKTHLEVFAGSVRADISGAGPVVSSIVSVDHSVAVRAGDSRIVPDAAVPLEFVRSAEIKSRAAAGGDAALKRWQSFSQLVSQDADTVAYYTFDRSEQSPAKLLNRSVATAGKYDGAFGIPEVANSNPQWSQGRWGKSALRFGAKGPTAVVIPADSNFIQTGPFSLACWLKRAELARSVHLFTQGLNGKRCFNLNIVGTAGKKSPVLKPNSVYFDFSSGTQTDAIGVLPTNAQWVFLVVTLDADHHTCTYVDGQPTDGATIKPPDVQRNADFYIGRASAQAVGLSQADYFIGWMDELAIFKRRLSEIEIRRMYEAGSPQE